MKLICAGLASAFFCALSSAQEAPPNEMVKAACERQSRYANATVTFQIREPNPLDAKAPLESINTLIVSGDKYRIELHHPFHNAFGTRPIPNSKISTADGVQCREMINSPGHLTGIIHKEMAFHDIHGGGFMQPLAFFLRGSDERTSPLTLKAYADSRRTRKIDSADCREYTHSAQRLTIWCDPTKQNNVVRIEQGSAEKPTSICSIKYGRNGEEWLLDRWSVVDNYIVKYPRTYEVQVTGFTRDVAADPALFRIEFPEGCYVEDESNPRGFTSPEATTPAPTRQSWWPKILIGSVALGLLVAFFWFRRRSRASQPVG